MYTGRSTSLMTMMSGAGLLAMLGTAHAAATPAQNCQSGKNQAVAKYAGCRQQAEGKFAISLDGAKRTADLGKCEAKYQASWPALETKAVAKGGVCPSVGDQTAIQGVVDQHTGNIATALGGGVLQNCPADLSTCNSSLASTQASLVICQNDLAACQAAPQGQRLKTGQTLCIDNSGTVIPCAGTGQDGEFQKGLARSYTDNGNGTITDNRTGLMWEKLSRDGSIHDWDGFYTWTTAVTTKVAALNSANFGGFNDWRLPNVNELQSLANYGAYRPAVFPAFDTNCVASCTILTCSCTVFNNYWSSTQDAEPISLNGAWSVEFQVGFMAPFAKATLSRVRAVRAGL